MFNNSQIGTPPASHRPKNKLALTIDTKPKIVSIARKGFVKIDASGIQSTSRQSP